MARAIRNPVVYHVSSTLLGRTKLQAISTDPTPPKPPPKPTRPHRPRLERASLSRYL